MRRLTISAVFAAAVLAGGCNMTFEKDEKAAAFKRFQLARVQLACGVGDEYLKTGQLDQARARAVAVLKIDADHLPARVLLAKVMLERGQYTQAAEELQKAQTLAPKNPEVHYLLGVAREKLGDHAAALSAYQTARALDPTNAAYVNSSAEVLVAMGRAKGALELLETRMEKTDPDAATLALAGKLAMLVDRPAKAAELFQRCVDMDPRRPAFREELARAQFFAGHYSEAVEALTKLTKLTQYRSSAAWAYLMLGHSHRALNRPARAAGAYETAVHVSPDDPQAWLSLAKAALDAGDRRRATLAARQARLLDRDNLEATLLLGMLLLGDGQPARAVGLLTAAAAKHPDDPTVQCMLGRCHAAMGRNDRAVACYVQALRSDPTHRLARALLAETGRRPQVRP